MHRVSGENVDICIQIHISMYGDNLVLFSSVFRFLFRSSSYDGSNIEKTKPVATNKKNRSHL